MNLRQPWHGVPVYGWIIVGTVAGAGGFIVYRKRKAAATAAASSSSGTTSSANGATSLQSGIDPSTGVPYAQEEAAYYGQSGGASSVSAGQYGYNSATPANTPNGTSTLTGLIDNAGGPLTVPAGTGSDQVFTTPSGQEYGYVSTPNQASALEQAGQTLYSFANPYSATAVSGQGAANLGAGGAEFYLIPSTQQASS